MATQTPILTVDLSEVEMRRDLEVKTSLSSDFSSKIYLYQAFGIFVIECNVPICALASSPLLNINLIAGKLAILAQKHISLETVKTLVQRETSQGCMGQVGKSRKP